MYEWYTKQRSSQEENRTPTEQQVNPPTQPGEDADSARVAGEGVDTTDAVHQ